MNGSDTPINRYLWAAEPAVAEISSGRLIQGRYEVVAPQIWRDTQPELDPYVPQELPDEILPYLYLYPQRLHVPEVYGWAVLGEPPETAEVVLLDNVPIDADGDLYPAIEQEWSQGSAVRQVYWLWQIFQLWGHLSEQGVASSLLVPENIRVQGGRVWLLQLFADAVGGVTQESGAEGEITPLTPSLKHLGDRWIEWSQTAQASVANRLQEIAILLDGDEVDLEAIATQLNQLLLEEAAQIPLRLQVAGASDTGPQRAGNEDACYPQASDLEDIAAQPNDLLIPHFTLVCDGIGGHEGGEVASSLALQTLKLQVRALLVEIAEQTQIVPPTLVMEQISAIIRVVNNMIASQNDTQGRESRARMATTLVMALQLPQKIRKSDGSELLNAHELYIANVGDSRAYWITADYCQQITLDDDVATREVRLGRAIYREALKRPDAGALTQALGTRDGELLHPTIGRLIVEEDGLLLLCSDGLSDHNLVEESWKEFAKPLLKGKVSTEAAVQSWINLANEKNGHDNTSVVLTCCLVSKEPPTLFEPKLVTAEVQIPRTRLESELTAASRALLYDESGVIQQREPISVTPNKNWGKVLGLLALLLLVSVAGYAAWVTSKPQTAPQPEQSQPESPQ